MGNDYRKWIEYLRNNVVRDLPDDFPKELLDDKQFVLLAFKGYLVSTIVPLMSDRLKEDREVVIASINDYGDTIKYFPKYIDDKEMALLAVKSSGSSLAYLSDRLRDDDEVVSLAIKQNGRVVEYASDRFKDDEAFMLKAINNNASAIKYASSRLIKDRDFIFKAVTLNGAALVRGMDVPLFANMRYNEDNELVTKAVSNFGMALSVASESLRDDKEIVLTAVNHPTLTPMGNESSYPFASFNLQNDIDVITSAVKNCVGVIEDLPKDKLNDRNLVLALMKVNPGIYEMLPSKCRADKEITLIAVANDGFYLLMASKELQDDKDVVLTALKNSTHLDPRDIFENYVSKRLQDDPDVLSLIGWL